jgi:hypothetical protein
VEGKIVKINPKKKYIVKDSKGKLFMMEGDDFRLEDKTFGFKAVGEVKAISSKWVRDGDGFQYKVAETASSRYEVYRDFSANEVNK